MYIIICKVQRALNKIKIKKCASGSGVEYNLAKVGVAGSNPVSRSFYYRNFFTGISVFCFSKNFFTKERSSYDSGHCSA